MNEGAGDPRAIPFLIAVDENHFRKAQLAQELKQMPIGTLTAVILKEGDLYVVQFETLEIPT